MGSFKCKEEWPSFSTSALCLRALVLEAEDTYQKWQNSQFLSLFCILRTWFNNRQVGHATIEQNVTYTPFLAKYSWTEMWVKLHLQPRSFQTAASPQENYNLE